MTIWRMPDPPTARVVWDRHGREWHRTAGRWHPANSPGHDDTQARDWPLLLAWRGPVTDVDPKAAHQPVLDAGTMCGLPGCAQPVRHSIHDADAAGWREAAAVLGVDIDDYQGGSQ